MNVSHELKLIWFAPPRTASRALHTILCRYDFFDATIGEHAKLKNYPPTHECKIPTGLEHYNFLLQTRNPYSRVVSLWNLETRNNSTNQSFNEFVTFYTNAARCEERYKNYLNVVAKYIIRYENFAEDVLKLDFVDFTDKEIIKDYNNCILNNIYTHERNQLSVDNYADWKHYYSKEKADLVYEMYEGHFLKFNYDKDSWKK